MSRDERKMRVEGQTATIAVMMLMIVLLILICGVLAHENSQLRADCIIDKTEVQVLNAG